MYSLNLFKVTGMIKVILIKLTKQTCSKFYGYSMMFVVKEYLKIWIFKIHHSNLTLIQILLDSYL